MELLVVIGIIAILAAAAVPTFVSWRQNMEFRESARILNAALREARSFSISENRQYQVVIDPANRRFRFGRGNATANSVFESVPTPGLRVAATAIGASWTFLPPQITIVSDAAITQITFSPNGAAAFDVVSAQAMIRIQDEVGTDRYRVTVQQTGRILTTKPTL